MDLPALIGVSLVCAMGAMSPGPSLAVVLRNTISGGRTQGVMTGIGHGIGFGTVIAYAAKKNKIKKKVFVIISEGELYEGSTWEAMMLLSSLKLKNVITILDINNNQKKNSNLTKKKNEPLPSFIKKEVGSENKNKSNKKNNQKKNNGFLSFFSFNKIDFEEKYNSCEELLKINKTVISEQTSKISEQDNLIKQINELKNNINLKSDLDKNKQLEINALKAEIYRLEKLVEILSLEIE